MKKSIALLKQKNYDERKKIIELIRNIEGFVGEEERNEVISVFKFSEGDIEIFNNSELGVALICADSILFDIKKFNDIFNKIKEEI